MGADLVLPLADIASFAALLWIVQLSPASRWFYFSFLPDAVASNRSPRIGRFFLWRPLRSIIIVKMRNRTRHQWSRLLPVLRGFPGKTSKIISRQVADQSIQIHSIPFLPEPAPARPSDPLHR